MIEKQKSTRFLELDVLRGLAAIAVVLYHYTFQYSQIIEPVNSYWFSFKHGFLGVELFFIISGFVVFMTLEKCKTGKDFIISRFSRLYPVYWCAILLTVSASFLLPMKDHPLGLETILFNFSMLQGYFYLPNVDGVYWSLNIELSFYFCMFILYKMNLLSKMEVILIFWLILSCLLSVAGKYEIHIFYAIYNVLVLQYIPLFAAGIIFYFIWKKQTISLLHGLMLCLCIVTQILHSGLDTRLIAVTLYFIIFILGVFSKLTWMVNRPLIFFGNISYALYLIHQMIGYRIIYHLSQQGLDYNYAIMIAIVISMTLATLLTKLIEQPVLKFIKNHRQKKSLQAVGNTPLVRGLRK